VQLYGHIIGISRQSGERGGRKVWAEYEGKERGRKEVYESQGKIRRVCRWQPRMGKGRER